MSSRTEGDLIVKAERLAKFLARSGVASRRKSEEIVRSGRVRVNAVTVTDPAYGVDPAGDEVTLDNRPLRPAAARCYIALNKPPGYLSDLADIKGKDRPLARRLITLKVPLFPVGRLDYTSEGLMIFTNDGHFADLIMHPRYEVEKEYHAKLTGRLTQAELKRAVSGLVIEEGTYRFKSITVLREADKHTWYSIVVTEGKYHHVRKVAEALSHPVLKLRRVRIDGLRLGALKPGEWAHIAPGEIGRILKERPTGGQAGAGDRQTVRPRTPAPPRPGSPGRRGPAARPERTRRGRP